MSTRNAIVTVFEQVAREQARTLAPLSDNLKMTKCGLDSLSFAVVVATLEDVLEVDPFNTGSWVDFPVTFGEFVRLYDHAVA